MHPEQSLRRPQDQSGRGARLELNSAEIGKKARKRIAYRLLPFAFILYVIAYVDRLNVSFGGLRMNAELGLSDGAFGLGAGMFYLSYILFEIPGALIVERWSARKWIGRIMISWGVVTILTAFVHTGMRFYGARVLLGLAEASFFPGMIVYLARWFSLRDRRRALACLYTANPAASLVGAPVAGWLLGADWPWLASWRWLFILEGIPAVVLGVLALFRLTDRPEEAHWLPQEERFWITNEIEREVQAKEKVKKYTIAAAFGDRRVLRIGHQKAALSANIGLLVTDRALVAIESRAQPGRVGQSCQIRILPGVRTEPHIAAVVTDRLQLRHAPSAFIEKRRFVGFQSCYRLACPRQGRRELPDPFERCKGKRRTRLPTQGARIAANETSSLFLQARSGDVHRGEACSVSRWETYFQSNPDIRPFA